MLTKSAKKIISASLDANSNPQFIGQFSYCDKCGDPAGFLSPRLIYPYFPNQPVICKTCGHRDYDLSGYCLVSTADLSIESPIFPTKCEAKHFGEIFGAHYNSGFTTYRYEAFFNGKRTADLLARKEWLIKLTKGREIYERLTAELSNDLTVEYLHTLAVSLQLNGYGLPALAMPERIG